MRSWRCRISALVAAALALLCGACSSGPTLPLHVRLTATPAAAAFDMPVRFAASGLPSRALVTLQARARDHLGRLWESTAEFRASAAGTLNLATAVPVSGSYHVADEAGLLWSLRPAFTSSPDTQFYMAYSGFRVTVRVLVHGRMAASRTLHRMGSGPARTQTVRQDGFASSLFLPAKVRPDAPAVVVIGGSNGGEDTLTAAALAATGYPALALGYFKEPGLPSCLCDIPLEYFARAVRWLRLQPATKGRQIILYGASRGEGALLIASLEPRLFEAVIASSPSALVNGAFGGKPGGAAWAFRSKPLTTGTLIPVGHVRVPLLIGDGGLDAV
jgi:acyl-CoA thioester hydrolase/bile acid acetyltransferase-like protein/bile acid acyltransferase/acyl-CoA thioester hydrolase-like protein